MPSKTARYLVVASVIVVVAVGIVFAGTGALSSSTTSSSKATTNTSYGDLASSVITTAAKTPLGQAYTHRNAVAMSPRVSGVQSADYMLFSNYGGASANMTIMVFGSTASAQTYVDGLVAGARSLTGFTNENSTLANYLQYGTCFGYGQNYTAGEGGTSTGFCDKGNVFIQVRVTTTTSVLDAETDMTYLVGAAYESTT